MTTKSNNNERIRLEDIPKKNIYIVPDKYFDQLPNIIQSKVKNDFGNKVLSWMYIIKPYQYKLLFACLTILIGSVVIFNIKKELTNDSTIIVNNEQKNSPQAHIDRIDSSKPKNLKIENKTQSTISIVQSHNADTSRFKEPKIEENEVANKYDKTEEIATILASISDKEIEEYLEIEDVYDFKYEKICDKL